MRDRDHRFRLPRRAARVAPPPTRASQRQRARATCALPLLCGVAAVLLVGTTLPGASRSEPVAAVAADEAGSELWEQEILQDDLRREIREREERAWRELERARAAGPERSTRRARRGAQPVPFSPLGDDSERLRASLGRLAAARLLGWRADSLALRGRVDDAARLAARAAQLTPGDAAALARSARLAARSGALERARADVGRLRQFAEPELALLAALSPPAASSGAANEAGDAARTTSTLGRVLAPIDQLSAGLEPVAGSWVDWLTRHALVLTLAAVLLVVFVRLARQRGDLSVHIVYPNELRGTFRVRLYRRRRAWKRARHSSDAEILKGGTARTHEHFLVTRETQFRRLACRRYYLTIDGVLQDPRDEAVVAHPFLHATAVVRHRRTVRVEIDATPAACAVDVHVAWDGEPMRGALVVARGSGGAPREAPEGVARLQLAVGHHRVAAGSGDRVAEVPVDVRSLLPCSVTIDIARPDALVFRGCPPAVEPYLAGRVEAAAAALQRDAQPASGHRLLARDARERGHDAEAALHFEAAGEFLEAAELHATLGNYAHSGALFERALDPLSAAEMYELAGQKVRAGRAFEAARDFDTAIECYRAADATEQWVDALERRGDTFEAAEVALEHGLATRGIRLLQRVVPDDPHYTRACLLLADAFERERHFDLAARKLSDHIAAAHPDGVDASLFWRLADLHEKSGHIERALDVLEDLRLREPGYPNLAARAEELRKARSAKRFAEARSAGSLTSELDDVPPTVLLAEHRYETIEEIGRGGMGVVYSARDLRLGRVVALKQLSEGLQDDPQRVALFLREARAAAALNHPSIVTLFDAGQEQGRLFITMELLDGDPLHRVLKRSGRLRPIEVARIGAHVCAGLGYAHERGVIHRDIKPANLFLTSEGRIKITDFGLARVAEGSPGHSVVGGTPYYMAPEQTLGRTVDHRVDLYSMGVTLFELATGCVPFPSGDAAYHNCHTPPPDPLAQMSDDDEHGVAARLAALILALLAKAPQDRPPSATEVARRLGALARLGNPRRAGGGGGAHAGGAAGSAPPQA